MSAVGVLIVDDSPTMRALIRRALAADPGIAVVGEAADPLEAREKIKQLNPDVITLDIEMPNMNGLEFLARIMRLRPMPVIMVSNLTQPRATATLKALEIGAFDCIPKLTGSGGNSFDTLPQIVKEAARAKHQIAGRAPAPPARPASAAAEATAASAADWPNIVGIGSSTGGVEALLTVLAGFPANCPPTLIVQHLPIAFTASFAARLDRVCKATVAEARHGEALTPGRVYLAPGGRHLTVGGRGELRCLLSDESLVQGHRPSVDVLFHSIGANARGRTMGVILTGMGRDGAEGLLAMRRAGARTVAQDEATSLVYGMPKAAFDIGAAERRLPLDRIAASIFA